MVNIDIPIDINHIGVIYKIKNKINNKLYIGQTVDYKRRLWEHCRSKKSTPLYNSIKKYGFENFEFSIIDTATTIDELNEKEILYINKYNTRDKSVGYNIEFGGRNSIPAEETREKMSKSHQGIKQSEEWISKRVHKQGSEAALKYGKPKTDEEKKYLSKNSPKFWQNKQRSDETKEKIRQTKLNSGMSEKTVAAICKPVYKLNLTTKDIKKFQSTKEASINEGVNQSTISRWCKENKTVGEIRWSFNEN